VRIGYLLQQAIELWQPPFDGPATHVREVVAGLSARGHTVRLLAHAAGQIWTADGLDPASVRPVSVPALSRGPLRWLERGVRRAQTALRLPYANAFDSLRFSLAARQALAGSQVLLERMSWMGYGGGLAARWLGVPLVLEYNGDHLHDLEAKGQAPRGVQRRLSLALMQGAVGRAAHVVATGEGWRRHFVATWRFDPARVSVIENGTSLVQALPRAALRAFGPPPAPGEPVTLVYLGGFLPWHGVDVLLRAMRAALAEAGAPLRLLLIGSGSGRPAAEQAVAALGLGEHVTFAGSLEPAAFGPRLAQADLGLSPYCGWKEYSGLKLFDYKAAGLATIASGEQGQPLTLRHGETGWIVPPCDEAALTDAIVRLARDPALRRRLGQRARLEAETCHGWDHTVSELEAVFDKVGNRGA
jgi:glycosyltransferase involved in cell wall biosynthesis